MKRDIVLCDIDHVLSDAFWRDGLAGRGWDAYQAQQQHDEPIAVMRDMVCALQRGGYTVFALTARPERCRQETMDWLHRHGMPLDGLLMRPDDGHYHAAGIKLRLAQPYLERVAFVLDDRYDVCTAFHKAGLTVLHVRTHRQTPGG